MADINAEVLAALKSLTEQVQRTDRRMNALAAAVDRPYVDSPAVTPASAPPPSRRGKRTPAHTHKPTIADQILDLVQDEPRSGAELIELFGARSSVNQAVHLLEEQRKVRVIRQPPGRGSTLFVFPRSYKGNPHAWVLAKLGYDVSVD